MAKIETTFIRPKEVFNVDDGTAKVVYDGYQNNPHEIELKENLEGDVKAEINAEFVPNDNNNVVFKDSENVEHELITNEGFPTAFAGEFNEAFLPALKANQLISTTWQGLKDLRDNGQLIAGSLYRITDYQCTTTQENTRSAGHQFDIVLLALSANKLAEEGWAMMNESNIYDVTFSDGVTKKCWLYYVESEESYNIVDCETLKGAPDVSLEELIIDEDAKTIIFTDENSTSLSMNLTYNYFQNSNLSAWKVWYCLDNDTERFAWADGGSVQPATITVNNVIYTDTGEDVSIPPIGTFRKWKSENNETVVTNVQDNVTVGTTVYSYSNPHNTVGTVEVYVASTLIINGRGVIYRLIDEFNNDVAYDFKNIQYVRKLTDGELDTSTGTDTWVYTFNIWYNDACEDASIIGNTLVEDTPMVIGVAFNKINPGLNFSATNVQKFVIFLNNLVFLTVMDSNLYHGTKNNICLYSADSTLFLCTNIYLETCNNLIVKTSESSRFYNCGGTQIDKYNEIYIGGKKVLTET